MIHLELEQIGDDFFAYVKFGKKVNQKYERRKWLMTKESLRVSVKKIYLAGDKIRKKEMQGIKDYTYATGAGARGVYIHYFLLPGVYQVNERVSWINSRNYFITVLTNSYEEITEQEATCLITKNI